MEFIKLIISPSKSYLYKDASNIEMNILGDFLTTEVDCGTNRNTWPSFKDWALTDSLGTYLSGNLTALEKEEDYILLTSLYSEEEIPTVLKMSHDQFIKLLDDWEEKVCKPQPKEVTITHDNDEFAIETKN